MDVENDVRLLAALTQLSSEDEETDEELARPATSHAPAASMSAPVATANSVLCEGGQPPAKRMRLDKEDSAIEECLRLNAQLQLHLRTELQRVERAMESAHRRMLAAEKAPLEQLKAATRHKRPGLPYFRNADGDEPPENVDTIVIRPHRPRINQLYKDRPWKKPECLRLREAVRVQHQKRQWDDIVKSPRYQELVGMVDARQLVSEAKNGKLRRYASSAHGWAGCLLSILYLLVRGQVLMQCRVKTVTRAARATTAT